MKRVGNAFKGILGGFILIVIGVILLWWNEGNNVRNIKTIEEARGALVNVSSDKVDSANEGKLVSTNKKDISFIERLLLENVDEKCSYKADPQGLYLKKAVY